MPTSTQKMSSLMAGLLLGWLYLKQLLAQPGLWAGGKAPFEPSAADDLLFYMTIGIVIGGRLGQVVLYHPDIYLREPLEIFKLWRGGMSFHGGLIGAAVACLVFARRHAVPVETVFDASAAVVPFGLFFGRIANFINAEHWGRITSAPWGMVFPQPSAGLFARHPSQLYEALTEGILVFLLLRFMTHKRLALRAPGLVTGVFLIAYAAARIFCELFREPEEGAPLNLGPVTTGMIYSVPMILLGWYFLRRAKARPAADAT